MLMSFVRKLLVGMLSSLAVSLLFLTAVDIGVVRIVGDKEKVKHIVAQSGIYNTVIPSTLDKAQKLSTNKGEVSLNDKTIRSAAGSTFSPKYLEDTVNNVIDSTYRWLEGKTPSPDFNIDLGSTKTVFADKVAESIKQAAVKLPVCPGAPNAASFDAFNATCLPKGVTAAQAADQAKQQVLTGQGFLDSTNITAKDVKSGDTNQPVFDNQLKQAPQIYQKFKFSPIILPVLSLLVLLGIIFLSSSHKKGLRRVGITLAFVGIVLIAVAFTVNKALPGQILPKITIKDNPVIETNIRNIVSEIVHDINHTYYVIGGIYAGIGVIALAGAMILLRGQPEAKTASGADAPPSDSHDEPEPETAAPKDEPAAKKAEPPVKKPPRKILIK